MLSQPVTKFISVFPISHSFLRFLSIFSYFFFLHLSGYVSLIFPSFLQCWKESIFHSFFHWNADPILTIFLWFLSSVSMIFKNSKGYHIPRATHHVVQQSETPSSETLPPIFSHYYVFSSFPVYILQLITLTNSILFPQASCCISFEARFFLFDQIDQVFFLDSLPFICCCYYYYYYYHYYYYCLDRGLLFFSPTLFLS